MSIPIRLKSVNGRPPRREFMRGCHHCHADFSEVDGGAPERGLWKDAPGLAWFCSQECWDTWRALRGEAT